MKNKLLNLSTTYLLVAMAAPVLAQTHVPLADPIPQPIRPGGAPVRLEPVAEGLTAPNWGTFAPGDPGRLFVTDQIGILWAIELATGDKTIFADLSGLLVQLGIGGPGTFDERGFLGLAFHPDYEANGLLYTYTSEPVDGPADFSTMPPGVSPNHQSVIREWMVPDPTNPISVVDPTSVRVVLRIDEPQFNHNAGALNFGPDGKLFIALGDGGAADDQGVGHSPQGNGQDTRNVLGDILRIDPNGDDAPNGQYSVPADNPFLPGTGPVGGQPGCADGFCDEIFAYGFRNPFRFSFDTATGDIYAGDVGQNDIEEVDVVVAGGNYGWRLKEGSFCFDPNGAAPGFVFACNLTNGLIDPIAEYDHDEGIAVVGGFVYRGDDLPMLQGRYVFGDYTRAPGSPMGRLFFLNKKNVANQSGVKESKIEELRLADRETLGLFVLGFGQDADGELYVLANETGVPSGDTGVVLKIAPAHGQN
jgi:glucose/arabinose dehydrogenase